ncbi:MAG: hypothetical protein ACJ8A6_09515 [Gemmatimonadales bacterium]
MSWNRTMGAVVWLALCIAPTLLRAQTATEELGLSTDPANSHPASHSNKKLIASYDSLTDSTHLAVVTHKGTYFLWVQHPRLTWTVSYPGRKPNQPPSGEVLLVFQTQAPQSPRNNQLVIESTSGERLMLNSIKADSRPGPMTTTLLMDFLIPIDQLARALAGESMRIAVGGIEVKFRPDQLEALRDLLRQAPAEAPREGGSS